MSHPAAPGYQAYEHVKGEVIPALLAAFPDVQGLPTPFEMPQLQVPPGDLAKVCTWLKARGFNMLADLGGVDYLPREPRFEVVYHLLALPQLWRLRLRVAVDGDKPLLPTLSGLWPSANPAEREVFDQFGIRFADHPGLTRVLNPDDWEGHPLRKDYPVQGPRGLEPKPPAEKNRFAPFKT